MKRITGFLLLTALLCAAIAPAVRAAILLPKTLTLQVNVRLRAEPDADSATRMILMKGYEVTALSVAGSWMRVRYGNHYGYVRSDLLFPEGYEGGHVPLERGARGAEVRALQEALLAMGFFDATPDGLFGEDTGRAVTALQAACGLAPTGIADAETCALIDALMRGAGAVDPGQDPRDYPGS